MKSANTNRTTSSDRANYERKSWGRSFGPKKDGKRFVAKADRRAAKADCRAYKG